MGNWATRPASMFVQINAYNLTIWGLPEKGVPQNGWFTTEGPIKMHGGTPILGNPQMYVDTRIMINENNTYTKSNNKDLNKNCNIYIYI